MTAELFIDACQRGDTEFVLNYFAQDSALSILSNDDLCEAFFAPLNPGGQAVLNTLLSQQNARIDTFIASYFIKRTSESDSADLNIGEQLLIYACGRGWLDSINLLIAKNISVNAIGRKGNIPLIAACEKGQVAAVQILIQNNVDIELATSGNRTPLMAALFYGYGGLAQMLIANNANYRCKPSDVRTIFQTALIGIKPTYKEGQEHNLIEQLEVIKFIHQQGCNFDIKKNIMDQQSFQLFIYHLGQALVKIQTKPSLFIKAQQVAAELLEQFISEGFDINFGFFQQENGTFSLKQIVEANNPALAQKMQDWQDSRPLYELKKSLAKTFTLFSPAKIEQQQASKDFKQQPMMLTQLQSQLCEIYCETPGPS